MRQFISVSCRLINITGICGLYLFAAGSFVSVSMADLGMAVMFVAFVFTLTLHPHLFKDALLILSCLFGLYLIVQIGISIDRRPGTLALQYEQASHLYRLGFFTTLVPAFWLAQQKQRLNIILLLVLASFMVRVVMKIEIGDIDRFLDGERAFLKMSPNSLGLYGAAALLGVLVYARRFLGKIHLSLKSVLRISGWCFVLMCAVAILIFAQSRAVWIAAALVCPPILLTQLITNYRNVGSKNTQITIMLALCVLTATILGWSPGKNIVFKRLIYETKTLAQIVKGNLSDLEMDAYGLRVNWWRLGLEKWREKPLLGWGPYSVEPIMAAFNKKTGVPDSHFHNLYLQLLVQIGLIGFLFFVAQLIILVITVRSAYRRKWLHFDDILLIIGLFGLFAIASFLNLPSKDHFGRNYLGLVGGIAYAFRFSALTADSLKNDLIARNDSGQQQVERPAPYFNCNVN